MLSTLLATMCIATGVGPVGSNGPSFTLSAPTANEQHFDGFAFVPFELGDEPEDTLRSRPFVPTGDGCPAFCTNDVLQRHPSFGEDDTRSHLRSFLTRGGQPENRVMLALATFDLPHVAQRIPDPGPRAAVLMLESIPGYEGLMQHILAGGSAKDANDRTGVVIRFAELPDGGQARRVASDDGFATIELDNELIGEHPAQLIPLIVHELLHDLDANSLEEEVIATVLGTVAYADVLRIDPAIADQQTPITVGNNLLLLAMLNSMGRLGPSQLGLYTSPYGDVWPGQSTHDNLAMGFIDVVARQTFYATLPRGGTPGSQMGNELLSRFYPADQVLNGPIRFDEATIAQLDRGLSNVLPNPQVVRLGVALGLSRVSSFNEGYQPIELPGSGADALIVRPFIPLDISMFDPMSAVVGEPDANVLADAVELIGSLPAWTPFAQSLSGGSSDIASVDLEFRDLPGAMPLLRSTIDGTDRVLLDSRLATEPPAVVATYIVEGLLLHDPVEKAGWSGELLVLASFTGTLLWSDLLIADPSLSRGSTPGAIARNSDLLALLNSGSINRDGRAAIGITGCSGGCNDVLPGLPVDARDFADWVGTTSAPSVSIIQRPNLQTPSVFHRLLDARSGTYAAFAERPQRVAEMLTALDEHAGILIPPIDVLVLAKVLELRVYAHDSGESS